MDKRAYLTTTLPYVNADPSLAFARSLKPSGFRASATGKLPFPRPLSRIRENTNE